MPYASVDELPKAVRGKLSAHQQSVFRNVFNSMMEQEGMSESRAFAGAWSQAKSATQKAMHQGKEVTLDKPFRLPEGSGKKFGVYVKSGDGVKKVTFGDPNMEIRRDDPDARSNFRSRHSCDTASDKTSARYWSCRMWEAGTSVSDMTKTEVHIEGQIVKQLDEERLAFGWAYVATVKGEVSLDHSGEFIRADQLAKAATNFMLSVRTAKRMHSGESIGEVIHSMPLTNDVAKALGIQSDREGWIIAIKVHDEQVWQDVKSGKLAAFSIGGRALKEMV
jgi:cation transport regulator ChaB